MEADGPQDQKEAIFSADASIEPQIPMSPKSLHISG